MGSFDVAGAISSTVVVACSAPMAPTSEEAVAALATLLTVDPPASLSQIEPVVVTRLTEAVAAESRRQEQEISRAVDDALRIIPRPLRGLVKKLIVP